MIHHHECKRCTHQWCSSCMGEMLAKPEDRERNSRQTFSHLCWNCFEKLEAGDFGNLREVYYLYHKLLDRSWGSDKLELIKLIIRLKSHDVQDTFQVEELSQDELEKYSHELSQVVHHLSEVYDNLLEQIRTPARIELDRLQEEHRENRTPGENITEFWNGGWRPEGFVGDPPGKDRYETLFGLDMSKGEIIAPCIVLNDGTKECSNETSTTTS